MCGICGLVTGQGEPLNTAAAREMRDVLTHRGPDGGHEMDFSYKGARGEGRVWLGHRRLKIIDLSSRADQPMSSEDGAVAVVYNGEVYNFRELRRQLEHAGHSFRSDGDAEVILRSYLEWGEDCVRRLDGMFAFAIWDGRTDVLLLARDRTGKKPLFYAATSAGLAFASEIQALLTVPWVTSRIRQASIAEYLRLGYVRTPHTMHEGILQLPPASLARVVPGSAPVVREYWDPLPDRQDLRPTPEMLERVRELVRASVGRRLVADVPLGALLSGGVDSSIVVGLMAEALDEPVRTFCIGFTDDASFDERAYARTVAERFGTEHVEMVVQTDPIGMLDRLIWLHGQPFGDASAIPTYLVSELASQHVTVALNGDGGDEVFGGYDRFAAAAVASRTPAPLAAAALGLVSRLPAGSGYFDASRRAARLFEGYRLPIHQRYEDWASILSEDVIHELGCAGQGVVPRAGMAGSLADCYARAGNLSVLDQLFYANFKTYLPDDLAVKMDRMSMAHSLEARSPFLDTALVEYLARLPARYKVGIRRPKPLLRRAFGPLLPDVIWNRRKHGFNVPLNTWFRGGLATVFEDEVLGADARLAGFLNVRVIGELWRSHRAGEAHHGHAFWTLLTLERWLRTEGQPAVTEPPRVEFDARPPSTRTR
jgi:asparagine synthase (glutamine-hydrolysing)